MGEIADAMLAGECCQLCGEWFHDDAPGYPRTCAGCGGDDDRPRRRSKPRQQPAKGSPPPNPRKQPVPFLPEHAALGFEKCSDFEWRAMTPAGAISWWPHARKWRLGLAVHQGDEAALRAFLARTLAVSDIAPPGGVFPSPAEVDAAQTRPSYWPPEVMDAWGVPNPPPKGWRKRLAAGYALQQREAANAQ